MKHFYAVTSNMDVLNMGRIGYPNPPDNVSVRYSLDGTQVLVEGLFTPEEEQWITNNGTIFYMSEQARDYIEEDKNNWEGQVNE